MKLAGFNRTGFGGVAQLGILILMIASGCGTQVGNPFDEKKPAEDEKSNEKDPEGTPMSGGIQNDPLLPPSNGVPAPMQGLARCTATATLSALETGATSGRVRFVFAPDTNTGATISYTTPSNEEAAGPAIDRTTKGLYLVKVTFTSGSSCYLTLNMDETNLNKDVEVAITSP
jgi:hypothetical protein